MGAALIAVLAGQTARSAEPEKLLPLDTDTVVAVNLKQLLGSEFGKSYIVDNLKKDLEKNGMSKILQDIGLDPMKDLEKITIAMIDMKFKPNAEQDMVIIARGAFDAEKIFKVAEAESRNNPDKFSMIKDGDTIMFKYQPEGERPATYATVIDEKTIVAASDKKFITAAIKTADSGKPAPVKKELAELIKKADDKASIFIASFVSGKLGDLNIPNQAGPLNFESMGKAIPQTESALITVRIGADVALDVLVAMKDEESANDMRNALIDMLDQLKPLADFASKLDPQAKALPELLASVKVTSKNKDMTLTFKAPGSELGKLMQIQPGRRKKDIKD